MKTESYKTFVILVLRSQRNIMVKDVSELLSEIKSKIKKLSNKTLLNCFIF